MESGMGERKGREDGLSLEKKKRGSDIGPKHGVLEALGKRHVVEYFSDVVESLPKPGAVLCV